MHNNQFGFSGKLSDSNDDYEKLKKLLVPTKINKNDPDELKVLKTAQKKAIIAEYDNSKSIEKKKDKEKATSDYAKRFFEKITHDKDVVGWEWRLSSKATPCDLCKKNVGKYKKGTGPKFPAHDGCTCGLLEVFNGEI